MCEFLSKNLSCCLFFDVFDSIRFEFISMIWWCVVAFVAFAATWKKAKHNNANDDDDDDFNDDGVCDLNPCI